MATAMYAFSGDPITYGHIDIIERAARVFDHVVVGIGTHPAKQYLFSLEERTEMARRSLAHLPKADVVCFPGLLVDYAYEQGIPVIIKGVRNATDFEYEHTLHQAGETQKLGIDIYILFAKPALAHISSSTVKAMQREQGLIHEFVPLFVKQYLEAKLSGQYLVGVTGTVGVGKSAIAERFVQLGTAQGIAVRNIDLDTIAHGILTDRQEPAYVAIREQVADAFPGITLTDGTIDRKVLGERVFGNPQELEQLNAIIRTPLIVRLRRELYGKKGLLLLNGALLAETGMAYLSNNNVLLVTADDASQQRRMHARGLTDEQIARRISSQYRTAEKRDVLALAITRANNGTVWEIENSDNADSAAVEFSFHAIVQQLRVK